MKRLWVFLVAGVWLIPGVRGTAMAARDAQLTPVAPTAQRAPTPHDLCDDSPVILLPGYSGPSLFENAGTPLERKIWPISLGGETASVADTVRNILPKLRKDAENSVDAVVEELDALLFLFDRLEMNEDGSSRYDITPFPQGAENARWDVMLARGQETFNNQAKLTNTFLDRVPADHVYLFANDWRRGQVDGAAVLHEFIQEVKRDSGHDKVSFFAISYGGQLACSYVTFYGCEDLDRVVLHSPALQGSRLTTDLLEYENFRFDPATLLDFTAVFIQQELSLGQRLKGFQVELLSEIALRALRKWILPFAVRFGSFWDIVPPEDYERLKTEHLDPVANAEIIRKSDRVHREVMPHITETLKKIQAEGVRVALICGYGLPLVSGNDTDSDSIIDTDSTGGHLQQPQCQDPQHEHKSPDGRVDAAFAYLPEHTWYYRGQYHGQAGWDSNARAFYNEFLFGERLLDVQSSPEFPQFRNSSNPSDGVEVRFSGVIEGYFGGGSDLLLIKNLSSSPLQITKLTAEGFPLQIPLVNPIVLKSGETARLRCTSRLLPFTRTRFQLEIFFVRESLIPAAESRRLFFTALPANQTVPNVLLYEEGFVPTPLLQGRLQRGWLVAAALALSAGGVLLAFRRAGRRRTKRPSS